MSAEVLSSGSGAYTATDVVYDVRKYIPHDMVARGSRQHAERLLMIGSLGQCFVTQNACQHKLYCQEHVLQQCWSGFQPGKYLIRLNEYCMPGRRLCNIICYIPDFGGDGTMTVA